MKHHGFYRASSVVATAVLLFLGPPSARAGFIANGSGAWTVDGGDPAIVTTPGSFTFSGNSFTISEDPFNNDVDVYQIFTFSNTASSISFRLSKVTTDAITQFETPPAFNVALLDLDGKPLVSTVDPITDSYYIRDLTDGSDSGLPAVITLDTTGLTGSAKLLFRVISASLDFSRTDYGASVTIDDVTGTDGANNGGDTTVVPAPPSLLLAMIGGLALAGYVWRSRRRNLAVAGG